MNKDSGYRNINLDLVRVVALLSVYLVHSLIYTEWYQNPILPDIRSCLYSLVRAIGSICVPMFVVLSGYLLCDKTCSKRYYFQIVKIYLSYIICSILCILFKRFYLDQPITLKSAILSIFDFTGAQYGWYINLYLGLFLLIPFFNLCWKNCNVKAKKILLVTLIVLIAFPATFNIFNFSGAEMRFWHNGVINQTYNTIFPNYWERYPVLYYFLGAYLKEFSIVRLRGARDCYSCLQIL